jgi:hypothetical protein
MSFGGTELVLQNFVDVIYVCKIVKKIPTQSAHPVWSVFKDYDMQEAGLNMI